MAVGAVGEIVVMGGYGVCVRAPAWERRPRFGEWFHRHGRRDGPRAPSGAGGPAPRVVPPVRRPAPARCITCNRGAGHAWRVVSFMAVGFLRRTVIGRGDCARWRPGWHFGLSGRPKRMGRGPAGGPEGTAGRLPGTVRLIGPDEMTDTVEIREFGIPLTLDQRTQAILQEDRPAAGNEGLTCLQDIRPWWARRRRGSVASVTARHFPRPGIPGHLLFIYRTPSGNRLEPSFSGLLHQTANCER